MTRYTVHFSGRVQGVGFRFTTTRVAREFTVAGYVQNLDDGRVRLVVEGERDELDRYVKAVQEAMSRNPKVTAPERSLGEALEEMESGDHRVYVLPVVDDSGRVVGLLRMHDIVSL